MAKHPAAHARALVQELKGDRDPRSLLTEARKIADPGHAAWALHRIGSDRRLQWPEAKDALATAAKLIPQVDRLSRRAELWTELVGRTPKWREGARNPQAPAARAAFTAAAVADINSMADGAWVTDAIAGVAPHCDVDQRIALLERAARNPGAEVAGCKAVLRHGDERALRHVVDGFPEALRAPLVGRWDRAAQVEAAWLIGERNQRLEALRVVIWQADADALEQIASTVKGHEAADRCRVMGTLAARADKLGMDPTNFLQSALSAWHDIDDPTTSAKEHRKLSQTFERAGQTLDVAAPVAKQDIAPLASKSAKRHTLALVNGYGQTLAAPHLQAIGRAAPLCDAFGLDLLLVDFPTTNLDALADAVESETRIGEEAHVRSLVASGRLSLHDGTWPGTPVATTPNPDPQKLTDLHGLGDICLIMGLGHHGLPKEVLGGAPYHYEITGQKVSLETATAMGILAERLRGIPSPRDADK